MPADFFPNTIFAWVFVICVTLFAWAAAWFDARTLKIPKQMTYPMVVLGLLVNVFRAGWVSKQGEPLWLFNESTLLMGIFDGALFALFGMIVGFGIMFIMWLLKTSGGGDVKLFTALGAWLGPSCVLLVLGVSIPVLMVVVVVKLAFGGRPQLTPPNSQHSNANKRDKSPNPKGSKMQIAYSLPVAISLLLVLAWEFRVDLGFVT